MRIGILIPIAEAALRTVQMTLDEELVTELDRVVRRLRTTRSAFAREALRDALARLEVARLEKRHREGYRKRPVAPGEFSVWEREHAWGDE